MIVYLSRKKRFEIFLMFRVFSVIFAVKSCQPKYDLECHMKRRRNTPNRLKCVLCGLACSNDFNYHQHHGRLHANQAPKKLKAILEPTKCKFHPVFFVYLFFLIWVLSSVPFRINAKVASSTEWLRSLRSFLFDLNLIKRVPK